MVLLPGCECCGGGTELSCCCYYFNSNENIIGRTPEEADKLALERAVSDSAYLNATDPNGWLWKPGIANDFETPGTWRLEPALYIGGNAYIQYALSISFDSIPTCHDQPSGLCVAPFCLPQTEVCRSNLCQPLRSSPQPKSNAMPKQSIGPGTQLANLLKWFNIHAKEKGCGCKSMQKKMDKGGPRWCRDNKAEILDHLAKEAKKRKLPFVRLAAGKLVDLAIRRSEKKS